MNQKITAIPVYSLLLTNKKLHIIHEDDLSVQKLHDPSHSQNPDSETNNSKKQVK